MTKAIKEIKKPNFFIVGEAKAGTSSLFYYLSQHPDVYTPKYENKEPAYFAEYTGTEDYNTYINLFKKAKNEKAIGEASTAYLYDAKAPIKIKEFNPKSKIIILLRHPVERAYSNFYHNIREGLEKIKKFDEAIKCEKNRKIDPEFKKECIKNEIYFANFLYFERSIYYPRIKRYLNVFDRNKILFLIFEEMVENPLNICKKVFEFLEVDYSFIPDVTPKNVGGMMRLQFIQDFWSKKSLLKSIIIKVVPQKIRKMIYNWNRKSGYPKCTKDIKDKYFPIFKEDINLLEKNLELDLSRWY